MLSSSCFLLIKQVRKIMQHLTDTVIYRIMYLLYIGHDSSCEIAIIAVGMLQNNIIVAQQQLRGSIVYHRKNSLIGTFFIYYDVRYNRHSITIAVDGETTKIKIY